MLKARPRLASLAKLVSTREQYVRHREKVNGRLMAEHAFWKGMCVGALVVVALAIAAPYAL